MPWTLVAACAGVAFAASAGAASKVSIEIGGLEFEGLAIEDLSADLAPPSELPGSVRLKAARIRGVSATGPLSGFSLDCAALRIEGDVLSCERGNLSGSLGSLGVQDTHFKAQKLADGSLKLDFESFAIAGGRGRLDLDIEGSRWRIESDLAGLDLEKLASVARPWVALPEGLTVAGSAGGRSGQQAVETPSRRPTPMSRSIRSISPTRRERSPARNLPARSGSTRLPTRRFVCRHVAESRSSPARPTAIPFSWTSRPTTQNSTSPGHSNRRRRASRPMHFRSPTPA